MELAEDESSQKIQLAYISGVINTGSISKFERSVFRITRGKAIMSNSPFDKADMDDLKRRDPEKFKVHI